MLHHCQSQCFLSEKYCVEKKIAVVPVNTTVMRVQTYVDYEDCFFCFSWEHPFRREVTRKRIVPDVVVENVTRVVHVDKCCDGYKSLGADCVPDCAAGCDHGNCSQPFKCTCDTGYIGPRCSVKETCPPGTWGQDCNNTCQCQHGGYCQESDGACTCLPGYTGTTCEETCPAGSYGENCGSRCECDDLGHTCHHVTGDCLRCSDGSYGHNCGEQCVCNKNGTALCSHVDGRCFCEGNYFGDKCDLYCPFGYSNESGCFAKLEVKVERNNYNFSLTILVQNSSCRCPSDLWQCDRVLGCVCPQGEDCGIEEDPGDEVRVSYVKHLEEDDTEQSSNVGVIAAVVVSVVIIAAITGCTIVFYYR